MNRAPFILPAGLIFALLLALAPRIPAQDEDEPVEVEQPPAVKFEQLADDDFDQRTYVASANGRKIGTLKISYQLDDESGQKRYTEEEERRSAIGVSKCSREISPEKVLGLPSIKHSFTATVGAYKYSDEPFELDGTTTGVKTKARLRAGGGMYMDYLKEHGFPSQESSSSMEATDVPSPVYSIGVVRILSRLIKDKPEWPRRLLLMDISEPRQPASYLKLTLVKETSEDLTVDGKKANCNVFVLKDKATIAKYWVHPKGWIVQFQEKVHHELEVTYTYAPQADVKAALEEAKKFGADAKTPEGTALLWVKATLLGDQAGLDAVRDANRVETEVAALSTERQEPTRKLVSLEGSKEKLSKEPSEHLFRFAYAVRMDGDAKATVLVPAPEGDWNLKMEKTGETWKIVGIFPPL